MEQNDVIHLVKKRALRLGRRKDRLVVREKGWYEGRVPHQVRQRIAHVREGRLVMGTVFALEVKRVAQNSQAETQVFSASIDDINKVLKPKNILSRQQIQDKLPDSLKHHWDTFMDDGEGGALPPHRPGANASINLEKDYQGIEGGPLGASIRNVKRRVVSPEKNLNRSAGQELD